MHHFPRTRAHQIGRASNLTAGFASEMPKRDVHSKGACYWAWGTRAKQAYTCGNAQARARAEKRLDRQIAAIYASGYKKK